MSEYTPLKMLASERIDLIDADLGSFNSHHFYPEIARALTADTYEKASAWTAPIILDIITGYHPSLRLLFTLRKIADLAANRVDNARSRNARNAAQIAAKFCAREYYNTARQYAENLSRDAYNPYRNEAQRIKDAAERYKEKSIYL